MPIVKAKPIALITGASVGLGRAVAQELAQRGWDLIIDARHSEMLHHAAAEFDSAGTGTVLAIVGDVADDAHRAELAAAVTSRGRLDLLINNASSLGPTPLPSLVDLELSDFSETFAVNVLAPLGLIQAVLPQLYAASGSVLNVSSDAARNAYPGWGGYGATKSALDHLTGTLAAENPSLRWYAVDPGDMRTAMHQAGFPGEDITDRPEPESVVPMLLRLLDSRPPSGRYRAADFAVSATPAGSATAGYTEADQPIKTAETVR